MSERLGLTLLVLTACADPDPAAPPPAPDVLRVVASGDSSDAYDGVTRPVRTLGRALVIARADPRVHTIKLSKGSYFADEDFPYLVPADVAIVGPEQGEAILEGKDAVSGLTLSGSELRDVTLRNFAIAVTSTGFDHLENVTILGSRVGVDARSSARLTATALNLRGQQRACSTGVRTDGAAQLSLVGLEAAQLGHAVALAGTGDARIEASSLAGDPDCDGGVITAGTTGRFALADSALTGGDVGLALPLDELAAPVDVELTEVSIADMRTGIRGGRGDVAIVGGTLAANDLAILAASGSWALRGVTIDGNDAGLHVLSTAAAKTTMLVGGGAITHSPSYGVQVSDAKLVLGGVQLANPLGLNLIVTEGTTDVIADNCTWHANVQGADAEGHYPAGVVQGPLTGPVGDNFALGFDAAITMMRH